MFTSSSISIFPDLSKLHRIQNERANTAIGIKQHHVRATRQRDNAVKSTSRGRFLRPARMKLPQDANNKAVTHSHLILNLHTLSTQCPRFKHCGGSRVGESSNSTAWRAQQICGVGTPNASAPVKWPLFPHSLSQILAFFLFFRYKKDVCGNAKYKKLLVFFLLYHLEFVWGGCSRTHWRFAPTTIIGRLN